MSYVLKKSQHGYYSVHPPPSEEELREHYANKYYQIEKGSYQHSYSSEELRYFDIEAAVAVHIYQGLAKTDTASSTILDIGTGEGFFANHLLKRGWTVVACDYSDDGVKRHNPELADCLIKGDIFSTLEKQASSGVSYDFINLKNVLEHVRDPEDLLHKIKRLTHKQSLLRIEVPNDYSKFQNLLLQKGLTENTWFTPPEHLHYFTSDSLTSLVTSAGYKPIVSMADFPIELFLLNEHSNYVFDKSKGKAAHLARVIANNYIFDQGIENYIRYFSAQAQANLGRQAILYVSI